MAGVRSARPARESRTPDPKVLARSDGLWLRPQIKVTQAKGNRCEQHGQQRQRSRIRLEYAPNQKAPGAAGQMIDHQDRQAAQGDSQVELVGRQIGSKELAG